jgi:hypothetical protein
LAHSFSIDEANAAGTGHLLGIHDAFTAPLQLCRKEQNARSMKELAQKMLFIAALAACPAGAVTAAAQDACAPNWTTAQYKSFGDIQVEIRKQFGEVRILRVALCGEGGTAYFQIVIISGQGEVRRVQIAAATETN